MRRATVARTRLPLQETPMSVTGPTIDSLRDALTAVEQQHLLTFYDELSTDQPQSLLAEISSIDPGSLPPIIEAYVKQRPVFELPADIQPAPYYPNDPTAAFNPWDREAARHAGEDLLHAGKVGCFTVAGGQGSRLGFDGPKGCYPATPITGKPLFQVFAENILKAQDKFGSTIPWYIMTSPANNGPTEAFFAEHKHFGLDPADIKFFPQGTMPAFDRETGKVLLAERHALALTPDGHGGSLKALYVSGVLDDMAKRGVEHLSYFQVDNATVKVIDPIFLGLHASAKDSSAEMSSKMLPKGYPEEKLGLFCNVAGRLTVVEYSDMPMDLQRQTLDDGRLRFLSGSPAIHIIGAEFVRKVNTDADFALPFHRADKKVAHLDPSTGEHVKPDEPNAVKLEKFVFDALPLAKASIVYETDRVEEFAPIKNAEGIDSAQTSRELQTERAARWLEAKGIKIARTGEGKADCVIELSPLTAIDPSDLDSVELPSRIKSGEQITL
ncbi:MAG: UDPGP type 1 family protein [Planctomycetota bacterium]